MSNLGNYDIFAIISCQVEESSEGTKFDTQYYIWVIPFLLVQCSFFMIPHFIWKMAERGLVKEFETSEANSLTIASGGIFLVSFEKRVKRTSQKMSPWNCWRLKINF